MEKLVVIAHYNENGRTLEEIISEIIKNIINTSE
jgi:hypothetical protein